VYAYLCGRGHKYEGKPLYKAIVDFLRQKELLAQLFIGPSLATGPTVFFRTASLLRLSQDLPIVIEVVEGPLKIDAVFSKLDRMIKAGMNTLQEVHVLTYRAKAKEDVSG